jgi:hypothetical protein
MRTLLIPLFLAPVMGTAQSLCDSLAIGSFTYDPFASGLHIRLLNNSTSFISSPYFDVNDDQGVNIVQGSFGFFGILPGDDQLHVLEAVGTLPPSPFTGSLVLHYSTVDGDNTCTYPMDAVSLCPTDSCFPFQVYAFSQSGPINTQFVWTISDADNVIVDNGALELQGAVEAVEAACVPPGEYTLNVQWPFPTGQPVQIGVTASYFEADPITVALPSSGSVSMPFTLFEPCIDNAQGLDEALQPAALIAVDGRLVRISSTNGLPLGDLMITDAMGRTVRTLRANGSTVSVDLGHAAAGTYLLRFMDRAATTAAQRFILF